MSEIWDSVSKAIDDVPKPVKLGLMSVGALYLLNKLPQPLYAFYKHFLRKPLDLSARYGPGSWVIVTGGAKGIGFGFACEFAKRGFNIILVDLAEAIHDASAKLKRDYGVEVVEVKRDITLINDVLADIYHLITQRNLDISVLVNNAAVQDISDFKEEDPARVEAIFRTNAWAPTKLTRGLINRLYNRTHRSAIINLSSMLGCYPCPHATVYSCTKAYLRFFSYGLREEVGDKIDVLSVEPGRVSTDMTYNPKPNEWIASVDECVKGAMKELGRGPETYGATKHAFKMWMYNLNPSMESRTRFHKDFIDYDLASSLRTGRSA